MKSMVMAYNAEEAEGDAAVSWCSPVAMLKKVTPVTLTTGGINGEVRCNTRQCCC